MQADDTLLQFAETNVEREVVAAVQKHGGVRKASENAAHSYGFVQKHFKRVKERAAVKGYAPETGLQHPVPEGFGLKKVTMGTYPNGDQMIWRHAYRDDEDRAAQMKAFADALASDIPKASPVDPPRSNVRDLVSCYVLSDYHLGLLSWPEETGEAWDMQIAEDMLYRWFSVAMQSVQDSEIAVFAQLGDLKHFDGFVAETPTSQNPLDTDTRFGKMIRVAIRAVRRIVRDLLEKHQHVHIVWAEGNHDPKTSAHDREWMDALYEDEPRVTVDTSQDPYYCYEFGDVSLFFHHGHIKKPKEIDSVFVSKFREVFGRTRKSYAHIGHLHNRAEITSELMRVTQHSSLSAKSSYESRNGYDSDRASSVIVYHKRGGFIAESSIPPEMIEQPDAA